MASRACRILTETDKSKRKPCLQKQENKKLRNRLPCQPPAQPLWNGVPLVRLSLHWGDPQLPAHPTLWGSPIPPGPWQSHPKKRCFLDLRQSLLQHFFKHYFWISETNVNQLISSHSLVGICRDESELVQTHFGLVFPLSNDGVWGVDLAQWWWKS